jgi:DNA topoisomerase I
MLSSKSRKERQLATVVWLIDVYSLRVGNEKKEDEAETYGACSLLSEHCTLIEPNTVKLSFLGKDSMKFEDELICPEQVFKNFKMFSRSHAKDKKSGQIKLKKGADPIFEVVDPSDINKWLQNKGNGGIPGLSAKVFRTYNASTTFQALLNKTEEWLAGRPTADERAWTPANLRLAYNEANRQVAILCNHQKTVNAVQHEKTMQRTEEKIFAIKYDRFKELQKLRKAGKPSELKKQYTAKEHDWAKKWNVILEEVDLDKDEIQAHEEKMIQDRKNRIIATYERGMREKEYLESQKKAKEEEGGGSSKPKGKKRKKEEEEEEIQIKGFKTKEQVDAEIKDLDARLKELEQERKSGKSLAENVNVASCAKKILTKVEALKKQDAERANKENLKEVSLGTSKLNYIDPRVTLAWLKKWDNKLVEATGSPKKKGKAKKEEEEEQSKGKKKAKKESKVDEADQKNSAAAGSDKMELGLKLMSIGQFFPMTMQKKFKWAASDDDDKDDLSPDWVSYYTVLSFRCACC